MRRNKGWENVIRRNKKRHHDRMARLDWSRAKWFLYGGFLVIVIWAKSIVQ